MIFSGLTISRDDASNDGRTCGRDGYPARIRGTSTSRAFVYWRLSEAIGAVKGMVISRTRVEIPTRARDLLEVSFELPIERSGSPYQPGVDAIAA